MKPFQFKLQPVKILREHREKAARERYAESLRICEQAAADMQTAVDALTGSWKTLSSQLAKGLSGTDLAQAKAWCGVLELRVRERAAALQKARAALDAVWKEMSCATREREGMDKLFDKQRRAHHRAAAGEQQKHLDEMAIRLGHFAVAGRPSISALAR
jgi:flagellar export protein FliJ